MASPAPRPAWEAALAGDPDALVSQSPAWMECMRPFGYEDASRLYETASGARLVLPMVRRAGRLPDRIAREASLPAAWGMGGLIGEAPPEAADVAAIIADLARGRLGSTRVRPNPLHAARWAAAPDRGVIRIPRLAHVLDLGIGVDDAWRRLSKRARAGVRKAQRCGLEIECDSSGRLIPVFLALQALSVERWAQQQHEPLALARWRADRRDPRGKFSHMAAVLGDSMRVWVAWKDGRPAASMIVLRGTNASDTRGAMDKELAGPTNANDLLQWLAIEDACRAGCGRYHLGESGSSRSLAHFKEKFGARAVPYTEYAFERIPFTRTDALTRSIVKRALGFRDA